MIKIECPRCHNQNVKHFYTTQGRTYCRECIQFHRVWIDRERVDKQILFPRVMMNYQLDFNLTLQQKAISQQLLLHYQNHQNSLVWAVCGSGKTEIVFELIRYALSLGQRICFCIPRKELVIELYQRIQKSFDCLEIGLLYGGFRLHPQAQLIVCTMHQLFRFEESDGFDLMIADEVDAFPFYHNEVLNQIFMRCCLGNYVKLSATFSSQDIHDEQLLVMNRRYHGYDLPMPRLIQCPHHIHKWLLVFLLSKHKKHFIIYVPTLKFVDQIHKYLSKHHFRVGKVSSQEAHNQSVIRNLIEEKLDVVVSTTLLERGITIDDVQVIVYQANHPLFDERTLTQIAGRVGRKPNHPQGLVYFLAAYKTKGISRCVHTINKLNMMNV